MELNFITLEILAFSKIIFFLFLLFIFWNLFQKNKPYIYLTIFAFSVLSFYFVLSFPLQKMFWGNSGDEVFIFSFLTSVIQRGFFIDFFYSYLPVFYPPLYFWVTGYLSSFFTNNGFVAAKIGVLGIIMLWFFGSYFWQKFYNQLINKNQKSEIYNKDWFWLIYPIIFFLAIDFNQIFTKPYEAITALFMVIFTAYLAISFADKKWGIKHYLFFGISGAILFLTYYFWWFILIPSFFVLAIFSKDKFKNVIRICLMGVIIFVLSLPYILPLALSYIKYGLENWQATYFYFKAFFTFIPWSLFSWQGIIYLFGLIGLISFRHIKFVQANLVIFVFCYFYQFINVFNFLLGNKSVQADKSFLFLGGAVLSVGASYSLIYLYEKYISKKDIKIRRSAVIVIILMFSFQLPFVGFIDRDDILKQIDSDLEKPTMEAVAGFIKREIPDYLDRTWLSSGATDINAYIPLSYYVAYNPHFSHQASNYSQKINNIEKMSRMKSPEDFCEITKGVYPQIDTLFLFYEKETHSFPLFFWEDNYPGSGHEIRLDLDEELISDDCWEKAFDSGEWKIYLRK